MTEANAVRPPGPEVGEVVDGTLPGPAGDLDYRLYRPEGDGPHPLVLYFHGGGWVLGDQISDDPFCRDLCVRSGAVIVSANYRHGPEDRFPAAPDDAFAALQWVAEHAVELGGIPGQLAVAGWSAGANLAAIVCQQARDAGGPEITGQLLLTPVTDCDLDTGSYQENADGFVLTKALDGVVLGPLRRRVGARRSPLLPAAGGRPVRPAAGVHRHGRVRPAARRGASPTPRPWRRPACRCSSCGPAATRTRR